MDLLAAVPPHGLVLFGRGLAGVILAWAAVTVFRWRRGGLRRGLSRSIPEALIAVGAVAVWAFTVAPMMGYLPGHIAQHMPINLVPVLPLVAGFSDAEGWRENLPNLVANLVLYAPIGFGLRWRFGLRIWQIVLIAAGSSTAVEVSQALSDQLRTPDVNDVLLNTTGALAGAWAFTAAGALIRMRRGAPRAAAPGPDAVS